ncbi:MAG: DUF3037 domain-containing protein, partial [Bacteroidia bacterium]|nr:DUF3037 domain-containing protein [Bacteroidia bacterium]
MSTKFKYSYQIIRYQHDRVTGEFINVGLVFYSSTLKYLKCKVVGKYSRISNFFNHSSDYSSLHKTLRYIEDNLNKKGVELLDLFGINENTSLSVLTSEILPKDNNALYFSDEYSGIDYNLDGAFDDLFNRLIEYYSVDSNEQITTDSAVWSKYYK